MFLNKILGHTPQGPMDGSEEYGGFLPWGMLEGPEIERIAEELERDGEIEAAEALREIDARGHTIDNLVRRCNKQTIT